MIKIAIATGTVIVATGAAALNTSSMHAKSGEHASSAVNTEVSSMETNQSMQRNESTLWGIYGKHSVHDCPLNDRQTAEYVVAASKADLSPLLKKYGVTEIRDRYHSGLEHSFLWAVETTRPHDLELFAVELGIASWNELTIVPLITFEDGVVPMVSKVHGFEN
jgi:hypothetical protein